MVRYQPALDAAELRAAAVTVGAVAGDVDKKKALASRAERDIAATGFEGPAAEAGLRRVQSYGAAFDARAVALRQIARTLTVAAELQESLDAAAKMAVGAGHWGLVVWLNSASVVLDSAVAHALTGMGVVDMNPLVYNPHLDLETLHAMQWEAVPEPRRHAIRAHRALVLEAGPNGTTVMLGELENPARVITMVAGATTGSAADFAEELDKAQVIADRTGAAVVVWQGYQPPPTVPAALNPEYASHGAENLAVFQHAMDARFPDAQKTVVAHSYGTVVATKAAAASQGLLAHDLWILGSPGVAGRSVADLTLADEDSQVFVYEADKDPIARLHAGGRGALGASPTSEAWGADVRGGVEGGHGAYFSDEDFLSDLAAEGWSAVGGQTGSDAGGRKSVASAVAG